jgi:hypothetical protein
MVSRIKPTSGTYVKSSRLWMAYVQSITMATFTKLLVIRMAASTWTERPSKCRIMGSEGCFPSLKSWISAGLREKNATSEAETKPERKISRAAVIKAIIGPAVNVWVVMCSNKPEEK